MKKKRTEKHTIKRRDDSSKRTIPSDTHHNADTPCCDLIRDVIAEIFPTAVGPAEGKVDGENGRTDKSTDVNLASTEGVAKEQPLLGFMIQRYLIEQHQRSGRATIRNQQSCSDADAAKPKKKKKKKKKSSANVDSSGNGQDSAGKEEIWSSAAQEGANNQQNGVEQCDQPTACDIKIAHASTLSPSDTARDTAPSGLDCFLDSIIATHASHHLENSRANRDLESFAAYLSRKYNTGIQQRSNTQKNGKKKDSQCPTLSEMDLIDILPTIDIDELKVHATSIKCRVCQTSVNSQLKHLAYGSHQTNNTLKWGNDVGTVNNNDVVFVLDEQSTTISKRHPLTINGFDDDRAFDYVQMNDLDLEAGNTSLEATIPSNFRLEFHSISKSTDHDTEFLQVKPCAETEQFPLDVDIMINLVKSAILSCGIELAADRNDQQMNDAELETIVESAQRLCADQRKTFYTINNLQSQMRQSLENAAQSNNRTSFDSTSTTALNSCNEYCELLLKHVGNFLMTITKMTCFVGWRTNEFGPFLMECMVKCWDMFNITLVKLIEPTMKYRGSVLQLCRRPGVVPLMASDRMMRDRFMSYLHTKILMIEKLITFLDETLINPNQKSYRAQVHQAPSPLARLCVLEAFMSYSYKSQNISVPNFFSSEDDEIGFTKLLAALVCLTQQVLKGATKSNIETKERDNFLEVKGLYTSIVKTVVLNEADYQTAPEFIKAYHDRAAKERAKADRNLKFEPEEYSPELIASLVRTSQLLTMEWIYVLCMRQSYSPVEFVLPSRLENWMESISGSNIAFAKFNQLNTTTRCDGTGAKRRVNSIVSALLYRWLEMRCFEWHAELTQNELLTAVDFDQIVTEGVTKPGKKKKLKKKGGKPIDAQTQHISESASTRPEDNDDKSGNTQFLLVGQKTQEAESQASSPNAVDEDIDDAEVKSSSKPKSICIKAAAVDVAVEPKPSPNDQRGDKKAEDKISVAYGDIQELHNSSSAANTTQLLPRVYDESGSSDLHTTKENNLSENFIKVTRAVTRKTTSNRTSTKGSNKATVSPHPKNNSEQSAQTATGAKPSAGIAQEPKSTSLSAAKSANQVAKSSATKQARQTNQSSDSKPAVKRSPAIPAKNTNSSDHLATDCNKSKHITEKSKPTAVVEQTATVDSLNVSTATSNNEAGNAMKSSEVKLSTKKKAKAESSQQFISIPAGKQAIRDVEPTEAKPTCLMPDASTNKVPMQTHKDENHQSVKPTPKEKVHPGSTQADDISYLQPRVGVIDNKGNFISAENFLVGRMESLLTEIEEIKSRYTLWF